MSNLKGQFYGKIYQKNVAHNFTQTFFTNQYCTIKCTGQRLKKKRLLVKELLTHLIISIIQANLLFKIQVIHSFKLPIIVSIHCFIITINPPFFTSNPSYKTESYYTQIYITQKNQQIKKQYYVLIGDIYKITSWRCNIRLENILIYQLRLQFLHTFLTILTNNLKYIAYLYYNKILTQSNI
eukprot:TRINITY_DN22762_c1_g2_i2.p1 TRINITY_DN22762_c1_g2~~TRINITY_DN22762_c1_g2_i2.p1  ORF type:complete len:208 (+),score=-25.05 TRINITY_DN22762_c1_g2_i2:80-625(+)